MKWINRLLAFVNRRMYDFVNMRLFVPYFILFYLLLFLPRNKKKHTYRTLPRSNAHGSYRFQFQTSINIVILIETDISHTLRWAHTLGVPIGTHLP